MALMTCGCKADGRLKDGRLVCTAHYQLNPDAEKVAPLPDLKNRQSLCFYCKLPEPSSIELPFFRYHPNKDVDEYYCGCRGWD